jgi:hypothetical protein
MSALQSGVTAARRDQVSAPIPQLQSTGSLEQLPPVPTRRVRGAQLAELGADAAGEVPVPARDPNTIGRQLAGLQAATNRASRETGRWPINDDDTRGSNA